MSSTIAILDPAAPAGVAQAERAFKPLATLQGKVVGFIDNSKPNFNHLVDDLAELLTSQLRRRARASRHASAPRRCRRRARCSTIFARECDLVITGSGD